MSFRKEIKSTINNSNIFNLRNWIFQNGGYELYPDRTVNSVYFDNKENLMYFQSIEGLVPRKKIRIRNYNDINILDQIDKIDHLEYKISSVESVVPTRCKYLGLNVSKISNFLNVKMPSSSSVVKRLVRGDSN